MKSTPGQFNTFQLNPDHQKRPGPTVALDKPFDKSSKKPRAPPKFLASSAIAKVNIKLNSVEHTLKTYMPYVSRLINEDFNKRGRIPRTSGDGKSGYMVNVENRSRNDLSLALRLNNAKYSQNLKNSSRNPQQQQQNFIDYRQLLIPHYFLIEEYTKSPLHILELPEFFENFKFNSHPPDYLISAILANSSLSSPYPELHQKTWIFFEYNYTLSLIQMSNQFQKPNLSLIQALLILWDCDKTMGKYYRASARLITIIKLCQTLGFQEIEDEGSSLYRKYNEFQLNTIRRIWLIIKYEEFKNSKQIKLPRIIIDNEFNNGNNGHDKEHQLQLKHQHQLRFKSYFDQPIIIQSLEKLPRCYNTFLVQYPKLNQILLNLSKKLKEKKTKKLKNYQQLEKLILPIDDWYQKLPPNIKYDTTCLLIRNRQNDPINSMRILAYLRVLNSKLIIIRYNLIIGDITSDNLNLKFKLIEALMKVCNEQLKLIQDWFKLTADELDKQNQLNLRADSDSNEDDDDDDDYIDSTKKPKFTKHYNPQLTPPFPIEYFNELGISYLQMLITLQKIQKSGLSTRKRKWKWKSIDLEYNNLFELILQFKSNWQGSDLILDNFEYWYSRLDLEDESENGSEELELPEPVFELEAEGVFVNSGNNDGNVNTNTNTTPNTAIVINK